MIRKTYASPFVWITAIALGALAGGYILVIRPLDVQREAALQDAADKHSALANLTRGDKTAGDEGAKSDAVRAALANFAMKLPQAGEIDKVLENVWHLAQANTLQLKTTKTPAVQTLAGYRQQEMDLTLSGDFAGIYQFLLQLEDYKRVIQITRLHLTKSNDAQHQVQAEITLGVFFEPPAGAM